MDTPVLTGPGEKILMYALEVNDLKKTYKNGVQALKGISLRVDEGDFFALLGPNGAGKSTLIGIISSLVNKTSGSVKVFGHSIDSELLKAKSLLGSVPQEFNFNTFEPVNEIITNQGGFYGIPAKIARKRTDYYLKELGLWRHRKAQARTLSGGMKRRLMIARALIHKPRLMILDEPTAGVDIELRRSMWQFMDEINQQGTTIILTTHYLEEAERMCRNVAIIDDGLIIKDTSMKSLLKSLNSETFVLYMKDPVTEAPLLNGFGKTQVIDEHSIEVEVPEALTLNDLTQQLAAQDFVVNRMRNKANRLEELFIALTTKPEKSQ